MLVVVTGGAGFIGSHLCVYLKECGFDVIAIDNLSRASSYGRELLRRYGIELRVADVRDCDALRKVLHGCSIVVHAAALIDAFESMEIPELYSDSNVTGTVVVTKLCTKLGVEKLIFFSSAAVYGEPRYVPIDENHPTNPTNPYGASKLAAEIFIQTMSRSHGLRYVILRLFNVYGPGQSSAYAGLISKTIDRVLRGEPPIIYGSGKQTRDFIYVKDVVEIVKRCIELDIVNEIINVGTGREYTVLEVVDTILRIMGRANLKPVFYPPRPGDVARSCADISKMIQLLGYRPRYSLEEGIRETISALLTYRGNARS